MKIFFDTEFTGLHKNTTLISIGMIDENCKSFYAEFSDYDRTQVDEWVATNVINNLKFGDVDKTYMNTDGSIWMKGTKKEIKSELEKWLSNYDSVQVVSDVCHYDFVLFIDIFGGAFSIPNNISPVCHDINQDIAQYLGLSEREAFDYSREKMVEKYNPENNLLDEMKHNSLYDALVIKGIYEMINR